MVFICILAFILFCLTLGVAPTPADAANTITVDGTGGTIYSGTKQRIVIRCRTTSTNSVLVNVSSMHGATQFDEIEPGKEWPYVNPAGLGTVTAKSSTGNAIIAWAVF